MKAKTDLIEMEITEEDYAAIQKVSKIGIFQIFSDQFGYWRQLNLVRIGKKFKEKCEKKGIDPKQVSPKFLAQFIEAASLDEEDDIQDIWADILTKEAQEPGSISLRTISSLKALSRDEADAFRALYGNVLKYDNTLAIYNDRRENKKSIADIIKLVDCGLLVSESTDITINIPISSESDRIVSLSATNKYVVFAQNKKNEEQICVIPIFSLTQAGQDILKATFDEDEGDKYRLVAKKIKQKNNSLVIKLFEIKEYDESTGQISFSDEDILEK